MGSSSFKSRRNLALILGVTTVPAVATISGSNELDALPQAPSQSAPVQAPGAALSTTTPTKARPVLIRSVIPPYFDQGVTMVPMRPLCDFIGAKTLYHDSMISISTTSPAVTLTVRAGGRSVQILQGGALKSAALPLPVEERLGTVFLPVRFVTRALGAEVLSGPGNAILIKAGERIGEFQSNTLAPYRGADAAQVTIANFVGRPLSLRLTGPQNFAIELGRKQTVTRSLRPGVYYYRAASTGMKTVKGMRRLLAGRKATWSWGRRS